MKKKIVNTIFYTFAVLLCILLFSCDKELENALEQAESNRVELERVLSHYEREADTLKYNAAKFLIENMPYHYSYVGEGMDAYDSVYIRMAKEPKQFRDSVFNELIKDIDFYDKSLVLDIHSLKSDQLIKAIDEACSVWRNASWNKSYDISVFYDYVLPYRIFNEEYSDWRKMIDEEYPYLKSNTVWSKKGIQIEAEQTTFVNAEVKPFGNAFYRKVVMLDNPSSVVTFKVYSALRSAKNVCFRYATTGIDNHVVICVNGKKVKRLHLHPTKDMTFFRLNRTELEVMLKEGENTISVQYDKGDVGLDCMQLIAVEPYEEDEGKDYSAALCKIRNTDTGRYIVFDMAEGALSDTIQLKRENEISDNSDYLRIAYRGYACWSISAYKKDSIDLCLESHRLIEENSPVIQTGYQNGNQQKWVFIPVGEEVYKIMNKDNGLFLTSKMDNNGVEILVQASYVGENSQKWRIENHGGNQNCESSYDFGSAMAKACKITDVMPQFEWFSFPGSISPKASSLCRERTGICRDEAAYTVFLCRNMGIPATVDFTPHWGNRSRGHLWSVLIKPDGISTPFYMGCAPGDTVHEYHNYVKPKVFRHRFQLNRGIVKDMQEETEKPQLFRIPNFTDVTEEYMQTTDVVREIPKAYSDKGVTYICVFDNQNWVPVYYGKNHRGKVEFKSMGRNIVYMAGVYQNGKIVPFGEAFFIDSSGIVHDIKADEQNVQDMHLLRKHPFLRINDKINMLMSGGRFQGSNYKDFKEAVDLHVHQGKTTGNWYDIAIHDENKYQYLRYIGPNGSYSNINEMKFFDMDGTLIGGNIIGSEGEKGMGKEKVFDNDILTTYQGLYRNDTWVGLELQQPTRIGRIRYIPRNDGNCIEVGDEYELLYWSGNNWNSQGKKIAQSDTLTYEEVPSGGLYLLRNHTKGKEERIFTYEQGRQVWW